jgi:hypothetical protein
MINWKGFEMKQSIMAKLSYYPDNCQKELRKTMLLRMVDILAVIQAKHFINTSLKHYY